MFILSEQRKIQKKRSAPCEKNATKENGIRKVEILVKGSC